MMSEPRSIEETERALSKLRGIASGFDKLRYRVGGLPEGVVEAVNLIAAERDSLKRERDEAVHNKAAAAVDFKVKIDRQRMRLQQLERSVEDRKRWKLAAESRIESLVGEREELREALRKIAGGETVSDPDEHGYAVMVDELMELARSVLSSRETTDSPTCPTCGSDDPKRRGSLTLSAKTLNHKSWRCTDTFHSTDRGKEDS